MKIMTFKGWAIAYTIHNRLYPQIETVRYTRKEAIRQALHLANILDDRGQMRLNNNDRPLKTWADLKKEGAVAIKVTLEQR